MSEFEYYDLQELNLDEVESADGNFEAVAAGDYRLTCTKCELGSNKEGTGKRFAFEFRVDANSDGSRSSESGRTIREWRSLSDKMYSRRRLRTMIEALGLPLSGFNPADAVGRPLLAAVVHEESNDTNPNTGEPYVNARLRSERRAA